MPSKHADPGFLDVERNFAAHIRDPLNNPPPADVEQRRMQIYTDLFYNNVEGFLNNAFPVLRRITEDDAWHAMVRDFFRRHHSRTPLFMEIPREFLAYLEQERGDQAEDPPFLRELAHYEWVELALSVAEDEEVPAAVDPAGNLLKGRPVFSSLAWPLAYRYPVHRIGPAFIPTEAGPSPTNLLVYRDPAGDVGFLELNPVSARLAGLLLEHPGWTGLQAIEHIVEELDHPQPRTVLDGGQAILRQWRDAGILQGTLHA